jgi:hypothetical protein
MFESGFASNKKSTLTDARVLFKITPFRNGVLQLNAVLQHWYVSFLCNALVWPATHAHELHAIFCHPRVAGIALPDRA